MCSTMHREKSPRHIDKELESFVPILKKQGRKRVRYFKERSRGNLLMHRFFFKILLRSDNELLESEMQGKNMGHRLLFRDKVCEKMLSSCF